MKPTTEQNKVTNETVEYVGSFPGQVLTMTEFTSFQHSLLSLFESVEKQELTPNLDNSGRIEIIGK